MESDFEKIELKSWLDGLVNTFEEYSHFHNHYQVWTWVRLIHEAVRSAILEDIPQPAASRFAAFWRLALPEFQIYYLDPIMLMTKCSGAESHSIRELDWRSLTPNGISLTGVRNENSRSMSTADQLFKRITHFGYFWARYLHGIKSRITPNPAPKVDPRIKTSQIAIWTTSKAYLHAMEEVFQDNPVLFITHLPSTYDLIKKYHEENRTVLLRGEGAWNIHPIDGATCLRAVKNRLRSMPDFVCKQHNVVLSSELAWQIFQNFYYTRWPAFWSFKSCAQRLIPFCQEQKLKLVVFQVERNLRERVWCRTLREANIKTIMIEPSQLHPDPQSTYSFEMDELWVDSEFTRQAMLKLGHQDHEIRTVGHPGLKNTCGLRQDAQGRRKKKEEFGLPMDKPLLFYATQNVADTSAFGAGKDENPYITELKTQELSHLISMAKKYYFHILIKPHRDENEDFYLSRIKKEDPVTVYPKSELARTFLAFADAVVTRFSTVAYEAMACGIPVYYVNFYDYIPKQASFEATWVIIAKNEKEAESQFDKFWKLFLNPDHSRKIQTWAAEHGWSPQANQQIKQAVDALVTHERHKSLH